MSFCRSLCGMSPKISRQIDRKLKEIPTIHPHITCLIVLSRDGQLIAQTDNPQLSVPDELHAPIASLKKTALELAGALNATDCSAIRLRGQTHTFCCYDVDGSVSRRSTIAASYQSIAALSPDGTDLCEVSDCCVLALSVVGSVQ